MVKLLKKLINSDKLSFILAIFVIELLSLISFKVSLLSGIFFVLVAIVVLMFTLYKLEYGLLIALAELMIGSQGYLFYLDLPGFRLSIRLAIFLIVFFVWLFKFIIIPHFSGRVHLLKQGISLIKKDRLVHTFLVFLAFIALGVINGLLHNNGIKNVFFDFNGYLYFGLFFVFPEVFKGKRQVDIFVKVFLAALTYVSLKIFFTLYLFSHGIPYITDYFYHWIRDTRVGEITYAGGNFFRIFFQSQSWSLIGIFVIFLLILAIITRRSDLPIASSGERKGFICYFALLVSVESSILISFSRSFWLGGIVGMIALVGYLIFIARFNLKKLAQSFGILLASGILSITLVYAIANFPIPKPSGLFSADMFKDRLAMISGEAGVSSRWNLLPVLINKVKESPFIGSGFGTTVTYQTEDPRIKNEANPEGKYTTYTFEWGYLDTATEIGLLGLLVYLLMIGQIFYSGWKQRKNFLVAGFLLGLIVLMVTHAFSPYLNHPLGISYLMLCLGLFKVDL
ncbi:MAG: hypothetical protein NTX82_01240 [Candidatus Parcubacteria bacterium]|nr:hypothetical protein [Candidatus Parcubacteria bacterium]